MTEDKEYQDYLNSIKAGDVIWVDTRNGKDRISTYEVGSVTPKFICTVCSSKFRKSDGYMVTRDIWSHCNIIMKTPENTHKLKVQRSRAYISNALSKNMTDEQAIQIADFIKGVLGR